MEMRDILGECLYVDPFKGAREDEPLYGRDCTIVAAICLKSLCMLRERSIVLCWDALVTTYMDGKDRGAGRLYRMTNGKWIIGLWRESVRWV